VKQSLAAGAGKIFKKTASGAKTERVQLRRALVQLEECDVLMVTRLDRLVRSTRALLNTVAAIPARARASVRLAHIGRRDARTRA
jgi:DNA invertase Pin-like site-specific DNA recombinase